MEKQRITNEKVLAYLKKCGYEAEDFRAVEIDVYSDTMNDGNYQLLGKETYAVKKEFADKVALIGYNFTHTKVTLFDVEENELDSTVGIGYDDIIAPTAFSFGDVA